MVDTTVTQKVILAQSSTVGVKLTSQADYKLIQKIQDDTITITPEGGDSLVLEALDGTTYDVPQKATSIKVGFAVWLAPNDVTLLRAAFGEPTMTGSGPYTHTFDLSTLGQDCDFKAEGYEYGSATSLVRVTGSAGSVKFTNTEIQKKGKWLFRCEGTFSPSNCRKIVVAATNLTT